MAKSQSFNVRVVKDKDGIFRFDESCFMHRCAKRGDGFEWVKASKSDRGKLGLQLQCER